ncbi:hypothetical protein [Vibrio owensii]|uniref:hypothetical protein n=1 Tax=Vibrio owensii TaxID=696485 RepID=UPI000597DD3C|nr:hypothetical protein [Vibrio owensii]
MLDSSQRRIIERDLLKCQNELHLQQTKYYTATGADRLALSRNLQRLRREEKLLKADLRQLDQQDAATIATQNRSGLQKALSR